MNSVDDLVAQAAKALNEFGYTGRSWSERHAHAKTVTDAVNALATLARRTERKPVAWIIAKRTGGLLTCGHVFGPRFDHAYTPKELKRQRISFAPTVSRYLNSRFPSSHRTRAMPESRVVRGYAPPVVLEEYGKGEMHAVMVRRHPVGEITQPVIVVPSDSDGGFSEEIVERVATGLYSEDQFAEHVKFAELPDALKILWFASARAALNALLPPKSAVGTSGEDNG